MVIFHSYVSLPEGITSIHRAVEILSNHQPFFSANAHTDATRKPLGCQPVIRRSEFSLTRTDQIRYHGYHRYHDISSLQN